MEFGIYGAIMSMNERGRTRVTEVFGMETYCRCVVSNVRLDSALYAWCTGVSGRDAVMGEEKKGVLLWKAEDKVVLVAMSLSSLLTILYSGKAVCYQR